MAAGVLPKEILAKPSLETIGRIDIPGALSLGLTSVALIFSFMMVDFFDTLGTVTALGEQGGFIRKRGRLLPRLNRVLAADSLGAVAGGFCGASSVTTYIESASGIGSGGRTGLTAVVVGLLFFAAAFFAPVVRVVPASATAPALLVVGFLMMTVVKDIDWKKHDTALAAFVIMIGVPLTYSISHGIGYGIIVYSASTFFTGRFRRTSWMLHAVALLFLASFLVDDLLQIKARLDSGAYPGLSECKDILCWLKYKCLNISLQ